MVLSGVGPVTSVVEVVATAVAAGTLLGTFTIGTLALLAGRSREVLAARALSDGYVGGLFGCLAVLIDLGVRYIF